MEHDDDQTRAELADTDEGNQEYPEGLRLALITVGVFMGVFLVALVSCRALINTHAPSE
jgi:hypothetical protein